MVSIKYWQDLLSEVHLGLPVRIVKAATLHWLPRDKDLQIQRLMKITVGRTTGFGIKPLTIVNKLASTILVLWGLILRNIRKITILVLVVRPFKLKYMMCLVKLKATSALAEAKPNKAVYHTLAV